MEEQKKNALVHDWSGGGSRAAIQTLLGGARCYREYSEGGGRTRSTDSHPKDGSVQRKLDASERGKKRRCILNADPRRVRLEKELGPYSSFEKKLTSRPKGSGKNENPFGGSGGDERTDGRGQKSSSLMSKKGLPLLEG